MFSPTMTRFIASLTMTLVMWLTCCTGAVAADGTNPPPCKDPWQCFEKPKISGIASGSTTLCPGKDGTWKIQEKSVVGKKIRCDQEKEVGVSPIAWGWEVKGPEAASGIGNSFTKSFTMPGSYTVTFTGYATSQDPVCDHPDKAKAECTFTVVKPTPKAALTSIVMKPDPLCINEQGEGICTISDQSLCDPGPYTVKWKVESDGGPQNLQFTPSSGYVSLTFMQSVDIKFKVIAGPGAKGGTAAITFTATVNGVDQTMGAVLSIFNPLSITHNMPVIKKWVSGENAQATLTYEGSIDDAKVVYSLYNFHTNEIQWTQTSSEPTISVPIAKAGAYAIKAVCCNRIFQSKTFICYTVKVEGDLNYEWDKDDRLKQVFANTDSTLETIISKTDQSLKAKDASEAKGAAGEANVKAAKTAIQDSISSCDGFSLEMSRKIQLKARELETNTAEQIRRKADMEKVQAQLAQIEQRLRELENQPNPSPKTIEKIKVLRQEQDAAQGLKTVIANDINQLVSKSFQISQDLDEMKVVRDEIQLTKQALNQALLDEKAAFAKDGKLTAPKVTEAKAIHETLKNRVAGMGTTMAKFAWTKGLPALAVIIDVINWSQFDNKRQELEDYLTELDRLTREHKTLLDNLKVDRVRGPLKKSLTVTTQPGGIPFKLEETPDEPWLTKEYEISGEVAESQWGYKHLILLNGHPNYDFRQSTENGVTGKWVGEFYAYGNLNSSLLIARVDIGPSSSPMWAKRARSTGATENQMITLAEAKSKEYAGKWKEIDRKMEVISTALSLGLGLGALALLIVGSALAGPVIIAAAVVGVAKLIYDLFFWLFYDTELMKSIKFHYPAEA